MLIALCIPTNKKPLRLLPLSAPLCLSVVFTGEVVEFIDDVFQPPVPVTQWAEPAFPEITVDSCSFNRLLWIDPLAIGLTGNDWERTVLHCGIREQELGKLRFLIIKKTTNAVYDPRPIGMNVYRVRLVSPS